MVFSCLFMVAASLSGYIPVSQAARMIPPGNHDPRKVRRWIERGFSTATGRVRLQAIRAGRVLYTTKEWVAEFLVALNSPTGGHEPSPETNAERIAREEQSAVAELVS